MLFLVVVYPSNHTQKMAVNYPKTLPSGPHGVTSSENMTQTDWSICVLCQKDTGESLIHPDKGNKSSTGYEYLAHNIQEFHNLGCVPLDIDLSRLDNGTGISKTLETNHATWHKSCWLLFCKMKLDRARKRAQKRKQDVDLNSTSPVKTRSSLGSINARADAKEVRKCFFCDGMEEKEPLHAASTTNIDCTVRECATELRDSKLLAKLAPGDMVALDAMYHLSCLTDLRNRLRAHRIDHDKYDITDQIDSLVFGELVGYIVET